MENVAVTRGDDDKVGQCKLCLSPGVALRRSHIVPELLWKLIYGPTGHTLMLDGDLRFIPEVPKGIRERLLCEKCEALLESYEGYFAREWIGVPLMPPCLPEDVGQYGITGIDYVAFLSFHLSIAWRASVSTHPAFRGARLGAYEEVARKALVEGTANALTQFKLCGHVVVRGDGTVMSMVMVPPAPVFEDGVLRAHAGLYAGVYWTLLMPSDEVFDDEDDFGLSENGTLILGVEDVRILLPDLTQFVHEQRGRAIAARDKLRQRHAKGGRSRR
jgi:hypothetical protein